MKNNVLFVFFLVLLALFEMWVFLMPRFKLILFNLFGPYWLKGRRIGNSEAMKTVAFSDEDVLIRKAAVRKIENQEVLENIALHVLNEDVSLAAIERITNWKTLEAIASKNIDALATEYAQSAIRSLKTIYALRIPPNLKEKIYQSQGHYDTTTEHTDNVNYDWTWHEDRIPGQSNHFDLSE